MKPNKLYQPVKVMSRRGWIKGLFRVTDSEGNVFFTTPTGTEVRGITEYKVDFDIMA